MSVEIREASAADRSDVTTLALGRCPDTEPWMIDLLFTDSLAFDAYVVAVDGDEVVGFGYSGNIPGTPAPSARRTSRSPPPMRTPVWAAGSTGTAGPPRTSP